MRFQPLVVRKTSVLLRLQFHLGVHGTAAHIREQIDAQVQHRIWAVRNLVAGLFPKADRIVLEDYFAMAPRDGSVATAQNEIDEIRWETREAALETLSYARDSAVVEAAFGLGSP